MSVTFIFKCKSGHSIEVSEDQAPEYDGTACQICWKPMLVQSVKTR